ncbi:MAG: gluconate 2-dehydrogenase subunit 3 family protein [Pyrinomonadaceae bacterium]
MAAYLDRRLAELSPTIPEHVQEQQTWRKGLKMVNNISQELHAGAFMQTTAQQRDAVLRRMAEQEPRSQESRSQEVETQPTETLQTQQSPKSPDDAYRQQSRKSPQQQPSKEALPQHKDEGEFFVFFKGQAARAYYTSEIGLLQELDYKGNQYLQEFAGYDVNGNYTEAPPRRPKASK